MGANSLFRRGVKKIAHPLMQEGTYQYLQCVAKAWDIRRGNWTEPELELLPLGIREGETALDLGANFGLYSYHLSRAVGASGRVFAFEPVPFTYQTLRLVGRLLRFRNVEIVSKGVSDKDATISFEVPIAASGALSTGQAYIGGRKDDRPGKEGQVRWSSTRAVTAEVVKLDDYLPQLDRLSFIKCDVEGAELFAFRGAEKTILEHLPTVICEINPWFLSGFNVELGDLLKFFSDKGYGLYHYDHVAKSLRPILRKEEVVEDNYVFLHPSRRDRFISLLA